MTESANEAECPTAEELAELLDGSALGDHSLAAHLRGCEACRRSIAHASESVAETEFFRLGSVVAGRYIILDSIGAGGMGIVYVAHDSELNRKVALKLALRTEDAPPEVLERLQDEARTLAQLSHPNIVTIFDLERAGPHLFVVMEHICGQSVAQWLRERPTRAQVVTTFAAAGTGLLAAHRAGICHGDFKPSNVIVADDGRTRVIDFGLAHGQRTGRRRSAGPVGTRRYAAPEVLDGSDPTDSSDTYSFSASLLEALTGTLPSDPGADAALASLPRGLRRGLESALRNDGRPRRLQPLVAQLDALAQVRRRRAWLLPTVAATCIATAAAAWYASAVTPADACRAQAHQRSASWDDHSRHAIRTTFVAQGGHFGHTMAQSVITRLDGYHEQWARYREAACVLELDAPQRGRGMSRCLERAEARRDTVVQLLATADAPTIAGALQILDTLPLVEQCLDPPHTTQPSSDADFVRQLQRVLVLRTARRFEECVGAAEELVALAQRNGTPRDLGPAHYQFGFALMQTMQPQRAAQELTKAGGYALRAGDTELSVRVWTAEATAMAIGLGRLDDGMSILDVAARRAPKGSLAMAHVHRVRANLLLNAGRFDECSASARSALALTQEIHPDAPHRWLGDLLVLPMCLSAARNPAEARSYAATALEMAQRAYGMDHPLYGRALKNYGVVLSNDNDPNGVEALRDAVALFERIDALTSMGGEFLPQALNNLASGLFRQGQPERALAVRRRAIEIVDRFEDFPGKRLRARILLAGELSTLQRLDEAITVLDQGSAIAESMPRPHPHLQSGLAFYRGVVADQREDAPAAVEAFERAADLMARAGTLDDRCLPYIRSASAFYRWRKGETDAVGDLLAAADATRGDPHADRCAAFVVSSRAAAALNQIDDPRAATYAEAARALPTQDAACDCDIDPIVERYRASRAP